MKLPQFNQFSRQFSKVNFCIQIFLILIIYSFKKFIDKFSVIVEAGNGGNGSGSFARDNFNPRGKCDGGNGGDGGNVLLIASESVNNLSHLDTLYRASPGVSGSSNGKYGMKGPDLHIPVPAGTAVFGVEEDGSRFKLGDCDLIGTKMIVAKGGKGGRGNRSLRSNNHSCETGKPGQRIKLELNMHTIADIGLVGLPNAGKSSLLATISRSSPRIAPYPFTTITPNVGVTFLEEDMKLSIADIPGLIDGAHKNIGLGHQFLKHVVKNRFLALIVDLTLADPVEDARVIIKELDLYQNGLSKKIKFLVGNKVDKLESDPQVIKRLQSAFPQLTTLAISAKENTGINKLLLEFKNVYNKNLA
jgi:GTP-binding protein